MATNDAAEWRSKEAPERPGSAPEARPWLRRHPWVVDAAVAVAVFGYNAPIIGVLAPQQPLFSAALCVSVGLCAPYVLRQRYPLQVFAVILLVAATQIPLGVDPLAADIMIAFALYNVATRFRWPTSAPGLGAVILWVVAAFAPRLDDFYLSIGDVAALLLVAVTAWTWGTMMRIRRAQVHGLRERALSLERERESHARIVAANERARIAREMHDIVSHSLSAMVVMADGASRTARTEPERAENAMVRVRDTGRSALTEMRSLLGVLRDGNSGDPTPARGIEQLDQLTAESIHLGVPATLTVLGDPVEVPTGTDLAVYRVVQESLTNVRKHAGPRVSEVDVRLTYRADALCVRITDDGEGPTGSGDDEQGAGQGIAGMRERVTTYGGALNVGQRPQGGFEVVVTLPIGGDE